MKLHLATLLISLLAFSFTSHAKLKGDPKAGAKKAVSCFACHGNQGISPQPLWPNLAGQKQAYLIKAIKDYKNKKRNDPLMSSQVMVLKTEKDIEDVTAYFASLGGKKK